MNRIRILSEEVACQIAAGEVVERPASVVRELLDNSIDADANRILVRIEKGGKKLIKISDNGIGMSRDDLLLCVERHATSKIRIAGDLDQVKTLGFRGEALSSIAAVSRMQIISRTKDQLGGYRFKLNGSKLISIEETGAPIGTTVEIKDLFFNIPARRKFLRAIKTEADHIIDVISRLAIPFSGIDFKLYDQKKMLLNFPASDNPTLRLSTIMGSTVAGVLIHCQNKLDGLSITAYLAPWEFDRGRGDRIFVYVNGRNIRDRIITRAVIDGYGQRLMKGRYPQVAIFLEIDPSTVDVNIHPTKQEIRFHNTNMVFQAIVNTIDNALKQSASFPDEPAIDFSSFVSEPVADYISTSKDIFFDKEPESWHALEIHRTIPKIIGQLGNGYILCQVKEGLLIIDQHAAHERIIYEQLKKRINEGKLEVQNFLIPHRLELTLKEAEIVLAKKEEFAHFGIELDHFGGNTFLLRSLPTLLTNIKPDKFLPEVIMELEKKDLSAELLLERVLSVMACHNAIRSGISLTKEESEKMLSQLQKLELFTNCPHGRPVLKYITYYEIEKMFKRVL